MTVAQLSGRASDVRVIGLLSLAHGSSHFSHLILPPMFPWLKAEFALNYVELGFLMTLFFVVSCAVQAASGFLVDRIGARPVLFAGVGLLVLAALIYSQGNGYFMFALAAVIAGCGNGIFHPVDYTLINHKVSPPNLPYAYSLHGITGYLGWAAAPVFMVAIAELANWRIAFLAAAALEALVLLILWLNKTYLLDSVQERKIQAHAGSGSSDNQTPEQNPFAFLKLPAVWLCWIFFFFSMAATTSLQSFSPSALLKIYQLPITDGSYFITLMSLGSAGGMLLGAYVAARFKSSEIVVSVCLTVSVIMSLLLASAWIPVNLIIVLFIVIGLGLGIAAPSRDLMIRAATPLGISGRVYGIVYSGIDLGAAVGPFIFGIFMDADLPRLLFVGVALFQMMIIFTAFKVVNQARAS